jgi:mannosyltransferase
LRSKVRETTETSIKRTWLVSVVPALLLLIVATGILLRMHHLARRDLWVDEALSVFLARLPWREFWAALWNFQANMAFYYFLLRGWLLLGDSEAAVRGLSVLFGVATIPATYLLGRYLFSEKAAIASAALSSVNLFQIRYSQEARGYSLVMLLMVLSTYLFVRALEAPQRKRYWTGYVLTSTLGVYVHLFAFLVVVAHWLSIGFARLRLLPRKTLFVAAAAFILMTAPLDVFLFLRERGQLSGVPRPTPELVLNFIKFFAGNGGVSLVGAYAAICLVALLWPTIPDARRASSLDERWSVKLAATWLFFPIASTLLVSLITPVFVDRYMAVCAPALILLAGAGLAKLDQIRLRGLFTASLLVMLALSARGVYRYSNSPASQGDSWRQATHYVVAEQQPADAVFFYRASGVWPFEYYAHREMQEHGAATWPVVIFPLDTSNPNQDPDEEQARLAIRGQKRIWLVLQHYQGLRNREIARRAIERALTDQYGISQAQQFSGQIHVVLYVRNSDSVSDPMRE